MNSFQVFLPLQLVAFDALRPLPSSMSGKRHVIVGIDCFTRFVDAIATDDVQGETFSTFLENYIAHYGVPNEIITDNAPTFVNQNTKNVLQTYSIKHRKSTPHHHEGNAIVERCIQTLQEKLSLITHDVTQSIDWEKALPKAVLGINTCINATTGYSPFELMFGRRNIARTPQMELFESTHDEYDELRKLREIEMHGNAINNIRHSMQLAKLPFERKHRQAAFEVGDLVLTKVMGRKTKLQNRYDGPYKVIGRKEDIYEIENLDAQLSKNKLQRHIADLKPFYEDLSEEMSRNQTTATAFVALIALSQITAEFQKAPIVTWKKLEAYVSPNPTSFHLHLAIGSPCEILQQYQLPIELNHEIKGMVSKCQEVFQEEISRRLAEAATKTKLAGQFVVASQPAQNSQPIQTAQKFQQAQSSHHMQTPQQAQNFQPRQNLQQPIQNFQPQLQNFQQPIQGLQQPMPNFHQPTQGFQSGMITSFQGLGQNLPIQQSIINQNKGQLISPVMSQASPSLETNQISSENMENQNLRQTNATLPREKRSLTDFIAGSFVSNILETVLDRIWPNKATQELQERENLTEKKILDLNVKTTFQSLQQQAMQEHLELTSQLIQLNIKEIRQIISTFPVLNIVSSNIISKIHILGSLIERVSVSFQMQRPDLVALFMLFKFDILKQIDPDSIEQESVLFSITGSNKLLVEFTARLKSKSADVFHVAAFKYWADLLTEKPSLKEYIGSNYVLHDRQFNCSMGLQEQPHSYAHAECATRNYLDKKLSRWKIVETNVSAENYDLETQLIPAYPYVLIYCYGQNITMLEQTSKCPPYPFKHNATIPFTTNNFKFEPQVIEARTQILIEIIQDLHLPITNLPSEERAIARMKELEKKLKEMDEIKRSFELPGGQVNYKHTTFSFMFISGIIILYFVYYAFKNAK